MGDGSAAAYLGDLHQLIWRICCHLSVSDKNKAYSAQLRRAGAWAELRLSLAILICQFQNEFLASPFLLLENSNKFWPCSPSSSLEKFLSFPNFYIINVDWFYDQSIIFCWNKNMLHLFCQRIFTTKNLTYVNWREPPCLLGSVSSSFYWSATSTQLQL